MKKTLCRISGIILFLLTGVILFGRVSEILRAKTGEYSNMVHSLYQMEENSVDVLLIGSSHGYSSFQPNVLWKEQGITSFSMCSHGQSLISSYYVLKEALKYQKPKVVLFESYLMFLQGRYVSEERLRQAVDGMRPGKEKFGMLNDSLDYHTIGFKKALSYFLPFIKYHSRWSDLQDNDFNTHLYLKGSVQDYTVRPVKDPGLLEGDEEIPEISLTYLEKIIKLCEENDIQLVVYAVPFGVSEDNREEYTRRLRLYNSLAIYLEEQEIPFLNYQKIPEAGIDYATDFRNLTHLNSYGAEKITHNLGNYLAQNYDLEDHRQDEAYQRWWEDYAQYQRVAEENAGSR